MGEGPDSHVKVDLDLRKLRYFVAVAEELHFGQAALRLYVAQPVLSRQIRKLEQELGVELFLRSSRHVELTEAGRQLLDEARPLLAAADAASRRVRRVGQGQRPLAVGFFIGDPISRVVRAFRLTHPEITVEVQRIYWMDQPGVLLDATLDLAFVHRPIEEGGLVLTRLYSSPRVALLPASHPLARREEIRIAELANDPVILHRGANTTFEAWHNVDPRPDGRRPRPGPIVANLEEKLGAIGAGEAISIVPRSAAAAMHMPPEVAAIPVVDLPPVEICLAWKAGHQSDLIAAFAATARSVCAEAAQPAA
jgi:DNA-binding transcriptional LysR family regulator